MSQPSRRVVVIAIGTLVLACLVCGALTALLESSIISAIASPTRAIAIAPTAVPPSPTPAPTATRKPIAPPPTEVSPGEPTVPPSGLPPEVERYVAEIDPTMTGLADALIEFSLLLIKPRFDDEAWGMELGRQMFIIRSAHDDISAVTDVPEEMAEVHALLLSATADFEKAMDYAVEGLDQEDLSLMFEASDLLRAGGEKMATAGELLQDYMSRFE